MAKAAKRANPAEIELRRWCVEMAMRWPCFEDIVYSHAQNFGQLGQALGGQQKMRTDADVIGRANKIMAWVKSSA